MEWIEALRDRQAQVRIAKRIDRLERGLLGDVEFCGEGVWELRIDWGPGYRVYYARSGEQIILLRRNVGMTTSKRRKRRPSAPASVPHRTWLLKWLKDPKNAAAYVGRGGARGERPGGVAAGAS